MLPLADEIAAAARRLRLPKSEFRLLGAEGHALVLAEAARRFVRQLDRTWWWEAFCPRGVGIWYRGAPTRWLSRLIEAPDRTSVWLIVGVEERIPPLVYSGTVSTVEAALNECQPMEYYVMAHGYSWFACLNHHDMCYGLGFPLMLRMRRQVRDHPEQIAAVYTAHGMPAETEP